MAHDVAYGYDSGHCEHCVILVQHSEDQEAALIFHTLAQVNSYFYESTLQTARMIQSSTLQYKSSGVEQTTH